MEISALLFNYLSTDLLYCFKMGKSSREIISIDFLFKMKKLIKKLEDFF